MSDDILCLASGLVSCSVCVPADTAREEIERMTNERNPTGISSKWSISEDPKFASGQDNSCVCDQVPDRRHWLLNC